MPILATAVLSQTQNWLPLQSCTDIGVRVSPLQAVLPVPDQFKFSLVTSVQVQVLLGALPVILSESHNMISVQHSESVVVRLVTLIHRQLAVTNAVEQGSISSSQVKLLDSIFYLFGSVQFSSIKHIGSCVCGSLPSCKVQHWTHNRMAGIQLDPFKLIWQLRLFVYKFSAH